MANHASAEKRNRQRITRTDRNRAMRSKVRTALKKARSAITAGEANAAELVRLAQGLLDSAATKNVVPKPRAARLKSRLELALNSAKK